MIHVSRRDTCDRWYIFSLFGFALFVHRLHKSEDKGVFHNHPWDGISLILGSYFEERIGEPLRKRRLLHFLPASTHHRIEVTEPVWTIFFHFRRKNRWTVIANGEVVATEPWRAIGGVTKYWEGK